MLVYLPETADRTRGAVVTDSDASSSSGPEEPSILEWLAHRSNHDLAEIEQTSIG